MNFSKIVNSFARVGDNETFWGKKTPAALAAGVF